MQTKYILHGGFTPGLPQADDLFFSAVVAAGPAALRVLLVYFAKELDRIPKNRNEDVEQFTRNGGGKALVFETADEGNFLTQVESADVVYFHGGKTAKIAQAMKRYKVEELTARFAGKIIAADSAGANVLTAACFSQTAGVITDGCLGLVPIRLICHFSDEFADKLGGVCEDVPFVTLHEYEFREFIV